MSLLQLAPVLCALLFLGIIVLTEVGRRIGAARLAADPEGAQKGVGAVEASVFGLVGLLLAFTFSGAAARFDQRRDLIMQETNFIGTAWLRLDLLPASDQPALRELFRSYLDARLDTYRSLPDLVASQAAIARTAQIQAQIWQQAVSASERARSPPLTTVLLPALNDMFDIATTRAAASRMHPPTTIYSMLVGLVLAGATLVGYAMAGGRERKWLHSVGFALVSTVAVYVIIDLEYPRFGFIRVDAADEMLVNLRGSMQ